jgi:hypothetical protein
MSNVTRNQLIASIAAAQELLERKARDNFKTFVRYTDRDYKMMWFHAVICDQLERFESGEIKKMMILVPPQHGKSQLATRLFPPYLLGKNADRKIAIASYNDTMSSGFNRSVQRFMDTPEYLKLFPGTKLNKSKHHSSNRENLARTEHLFELIDKKGSLRSVGRGGALTGNPVDVGIIDDLFKDRAEAKSTTISQACWDWYVDVFKTRLHNDSQQLIMNTRWDEEDLSGRLLKDEGHEWTVIKFPAIRTDEYSAFDKRSEGETLWPEKHSLQRIMDIKRQSEITFNSLYQQEPEPPKDLLIYPYVTVIDVMPYERIGMRYYGLDFGYTNDPTALIEYGNDKYGGVKNSYFNELIYASGGVPSAEIKKVLDANGYKGEIVFCDHDPEKIAELRIHCINATNGLKNIQAGIERMKEYKIHVTANSLNMLRERRKYQWTTYGSIITNIPIDEENHAWDAARYAHYTATFRTT